MQTIIKSEHGIKALNWLAEQGINHEFDWDNPTKADFQIWEAMKKAGVLTDRRGNKCVVINKYGPNPSGLIDIGAINAKYQSAYVNLF